MRLFWFGILLSAVLAGGCARWKSRADKTPAPPGAPASAGQPAGAVTPTATPRGKVALVNPAARYVIVSFPIGAMPSPDQRLSVYRQGLKVGELRVTGQQRDINVVADLVAGECQAGDEVRAD